MYNIPVAIESAMLEGSMTSHEENLLLLNEEFVIKVSSSTQTHAPFSHAQVSSDS